jgi:predicted P-loop ATPase
MIGTTNESDFLLDPTGNRRFFPLQIGLTGPLNLALQVENKLQYYAEALHMIKQNNSIVHEIYNHIDESRGAEEARLQATRLSPKHKKIKDWLCRQDSSATVSLIDMYEAVVGTNSIRAIELIELGQSMVRLGYECVDKIDKIYKIKYESLE